jgi:hypothetical protein
MKKVELVAVCFAIIIVMQIAGVFAITASIGNARMILTAKTGDVIEKSILVKNVNSEAVIINLSASGDLENYVKFKDTSFTLAPGEEKKANFTITVAKDGTTETKINVQFAPTEGKNGVGLSSTVIINAEKGTGGSWFDFLTGNKNNSTTTTQNASKQNNSMTGNAIISGTAGTMMIGLIVTAVVFVILLVLMIIYVNKRKSKKNIKLKKNVKTSE